MNIIRMTFIFMLATFISAADSHDPFESSFAARLFEQNRFQEILEHYRSEGVDHPHYAEAADFFQLLSESVEPDFLPFANFCEDFNPITAIWSQFAMALREDQPVRVPKVSFRQLMHFNAFTLMELLDDNDRAVGARFFLDMAALLEAEDFLEGHADPRECLDSYWVFWGHIQVLLQHLSMKDPCYTKDYLYRLLTLRMGMSAWLWDDDFVSRVRSMCMDGVTADQLRREIRYRHPETNEWTVRIAYHSPEGIEQTARGLIANLPKLFGQKPFYTELIRSLYGPIIEHIDRMAWAWQSIVRDGRDLGFVYEPQEHVDTILESLGIWPISDAGSIGLVSKTIASVENMWRMDKKELDIVLNESQRERVRAILELSPLNREALYYALSDSVLATDVALWNAWELAMKSEELKRLYFWRLATRLEISKVINEDEAQIARLIRMRLEQR